MKRNWRKTLATAVSAVMALLTAFPSVTAFAAPFYTSPEESQYEIRLTLPENYVTGENKPDLRLYQIFTGSVDPDETEAGGQSVTGQDNPGNGNLAFTLSDVRFGESVQSAKQYALALAQASKGAGVYADYKYAFSGFDGFDALLKAGVDNLLDEKYDSDDDLLAHDLATVIAAHPEREWLEQFCDVTTGFGDTGDGSKKVEGFLSEDTYRSFTETDTGSGIYTSTADGEKLSPGYYMIVDRTDPVALGDGEAISTTMLFVAGNVTQVLKESAPSVSKFIVSGSGDPLKADYAGTGDVVKFQLAGTLPSNFDIYEGGYKYAFYDTLPAGIKLGSAYDAGSGEVTFTEDTDIEITVKGAYRVVSAEPKELAWDPDVVLSIKPDSYDDTSANHKHLGTQDDASVVNAYTVETNADRLPQGQDGKPSFGVIFPCLSEIVMTGDGSNGSESGAKYILGGNGEQVSQITVRYNAFVTKDVSLKDGGNINGVYVEYSDNPQAYDETANTEIDQAAVYTLGLDLTKVNGDLFNEYEGDLAGHPDILLANVGFMIVRSDPAGDGYQIARFTKMEDGDFVSLASGDFLKEKSGQNVYRIDSWEAYDAYTEGGAVSGSDANIAYTDASGKLLIAGLDADTVYWFGEIPPAGFENPDPGSFIVSLKSTQTWNQLSVEGDELYDAAPQNGSASFDQAHFLLDTNEKSDQPDGTVDGAIGALTVANFPGSRLPSTGGIGRTVFYVIGGAILALSAALFLFSRKKTKKEKA